MRFGKMTLAAGLGLMMATGSASAERVELDFLGNAGQGLLPGNSNGPGTPVDPGAPATSAIGGEVGNGLVYDTDTNILEFAFQFSGLTGGLADVASGMHFHLAQPGVDPQSETGPVVFILNSGTDPNVTLDTPLVPIGATSATVSGTAQFEEFQEDALLGGRYYLNIHSEGFAGGEVRGNLAVPSPAALPAGLLGLFALTARRRRR